MSFYLLSGKWSGQSELLDAAHQSSSNQSNTVKATLEKGLLTLRLTCTTSDGLTSKQTFTFSPASEGHGRSDEMLCIEHDPKSYDGCRITLKDEGLGLFLLRVVAAENADRYLRVQTFTVTPKELVSTWYGYDEEGKVTSGGLMRATPVQSEDASP